MPAPAPAPVAMTAVQRALELGADAVRARFDRAEGGGGGGGGDDDDDDDDWETGT